jgi:hypothetical protein
MTLMTVMNAEVNRVDLFLVRTMGEDTARNRDYLHFFNPTIDFCNFRAGIEVTVPVAEDLRAVRNTRCYGIASLKGF